MTATPLVAITRNDPIHHYIIVIITITCAAMSTTGCLLAVCVLTLLMNPAYAVSRCTWRRCRSIEIAVNDLTNVVNRLHQDVGGNKGAQGQRDKRMADSLMLMQRHDEWLKRFKMDISVNYGGM